MSIQVLNPKKAYLIRIDGSTEEVTPQNGSDFKLNELKQFIGGGYIEIVRLPNSPTIFVIDEEGKLKNFEYNEMATTLSGIMAYGDVLVGDVVMCPSKMVK